MGRVRSCQPGQGLSYTRAGSHYARTSRPRLELLEDRVQPGDTILGLSAVALLGLRFPCCDSPLALDPDALDREWHHGLFSSLEAAGSLVPKGAGRDDAAHVTIGDRAITVATDGRTDGFSLPGLLNADVLDGHMAAYRLAGPALPTPHAPPADLGVMSLLGGVPLSPLSLADIGASVGRSREMFAATGAASPALREASLSFDGSSGQLTIRANGGEHVVREAVSADGFVKLTLDGGDHSSNPRSADFDAALAGAAGSSLSQIRFDEASGNDKLVVESQSLPHFFAVVAPGAEVITQDIAVGGALAIQAQSITVTGALQGQAITLDATGWVDVQAAGRIEATQAAFGGRIGVTADVFVNTGQLRADGHSGGQVVVQTRNLLNAGLITADGTSPGADGGLVHLGFTDSYVATTAALTSANGAQGGAVVIEGGVSGHLFSSGRDLATGAVRGGTIDLFGRDLVLAGATVDASGETGGGTIRVGGETQTVTVTPATTLRADAIRVGDGGRVSVWSERQTTFDGSISARGGSRTGHGGLAEVSGKGDLVFAGAADAGAPAGKNGTLLLDPKNLVIADAPVGVFPQFDLIDPHPMAGIGFYSAVLVLSNGNMVVTNPFDNFGGIRAGAVSLFDGLSGALLSFLAGDHGEDSIGSGVTPLTNGDYVVDSPPWHGDRGAVTWANGSAGVSGTISETNSLIGSNLQDSVGSGGVVVLSNGNYVVANPSWNGGRGAATWGDGSTGVSGIVSVDNSLVGSNPKDAVGGATPLSNGNYVVRSGYGGRGAVTWANGSTGISGTISEANSLVGSSPGDHVGANVYILSNGNYVVDSYAWDGERGAVTWGSGSTGISGTVSEANSLVGSKPGDRLGLFTLSLPGIIPLRNGNYVVLSWLWDDTRGAVTWGNGSTGIDGVVSDANSLVGSKPGDQVGVSGVILLSNGNYVVLSPGWNDTRGAVTWGNGNTGTSGTVSDANSLVGSMPGDFVGGYRLFIPHWGYVYEPIVTPLSNGNYVVGSPFWNGKRGAVTWGDGSLGVSGTVSEAHSLVGSNPGSDMFGMNPGDLVGYPYIYPLSNGNYVVDSSLWNGKRGAATWENGSTGISGTISQANSLVGSNPLDLVGNGGVTPLNIGNYVVSSPGWNGARGAVTWGNGGEGASGTVSEANSLVGSNPSDLVGFGSIVPLSNGNYVVRSPDWNGGIPNGRGAVTWGNGSTGLSGIVSEANSVVGSNRGDHVGDYDSVLLSTGNYVVRSLHWNGDRGAVTWVSGTTGRTLDTRGIITPQNSLVGRAANAHFGGVVEDPIHQSFLAFASGRVTVGLPDPNQFRYARGQAQAVSLTPQFVTDTLNIGTAVVLQASNDITVNAPIAVSAGGNGGALTLQAGRSIVLNAPIMTDNGALTLIANDQLANGVVDSQRDPGNAVISMSPGTTLDTGSGPLTVELRDGAGLTSQDSGAITLQTVVAGSVSVVNNGPRAGSDANLGPVTTSGAQYYANPHGTTTVTGDLSAADSSIAFTDSVVVNDGVTVTAGVNAINFVGSGTQTLQSGPDTRFGNINHTATGTLQLKSSLIVTGSFINGAGTFDANDHPVTVTGAAAVLGGTYLAGTAPQTFSSGLSVTGGVFTNSNGPMSVTGGITLGGGLLRGVGTLDSITAGGGTVAPGGSSPGILTVRGAVAFTGAGTLSILVNGTNPGTGYAQLLAGGLIDLSGSTLSLVFGFKPPVGSSFEVLSNTGPAPINGTFHGLDEGTVFTQGSYQFQITYAGGTGGRSVVLTRLA